MCHLWYRPNPSFRVNRHATRRRSLKFGAPIRHSVTPPTAAAFGKIHRYSFLNLRIGLPSKLRLRLQRGRTLPVGSPPGPASPRSGATGLRRPRRKTRQHCRDLRLCAGRRRPLCGPLIDGVDPGRMCFAHILYGMGAGLGSCAKSGTAATVWNQSWIIKFVYPKDSQAPRDLGDPLLRCRRRHVRGCRGIRCRAPRRRTEALQAVEAALKLAGNDEDRQRAREVQQAIERSKPQYL